MDVPAFCRHMCRHILHWAFAPEEYLFFIVFRARFLIPRILPGICRSIRSVHEQTHHAQRNIGLIRAVGTHARTHHPRIPPK